MRIGTQQHQQSELKILFQYQIHLPFLTTRKPLPALTGVTGYVLYFRFNLFLCIALGTQTRILHSFQVTDSNPKKLRNVLCTLFYTVGNCGKLKTHFFFCTFIKSTTQLVSVQLHPTQDLSAYSVAHLSSALLITVFIRL